MYTALIALALVAVFLFVACTNSAPTDTPDEEKVLTLLYWQAPSLPGSYLSAGTKDRDAGAVTLEPLAKYDPDGNFLPALAAEIPTLENGGFAEDVMSITWRLKEDLKWSDGSDMTAEDVAFTWRYCVDEATGCTAESSFDGIASVLAIDDTTVQITFDAPTPYPYNAFVGAATPIISRAQFTNCVGAAATTCETQNTAPLGTGPYRIISFQTNDGCLSQDIDGANRLLDDNDVLDTDGDGIREHNGIPLRITYQTSTNSVRQETQALISDWWRQIGIETQLVQHDASIFFGGDPIVDQDASYRRFFADVQMYTGDSGIDPQQNLSGALCEHIPTRDNNWASGNIARSCNPEYDDLFEQLAQTRIGPQRATLIKQLNDIHVQNYYQIPLVNRGAISAHHNTLQGVRINAWDSELWNIAEWRR